MRISAGRQRPFQPLHHLQRVQLLFFSIRRITLRPRPPSCLPPTRHSAASAPETVCSTYRHFRGLQRWTRIRRFHAPRCQAPVNRFSAPVAASCRARQRLCSSTSRAHTHALANVSPAFPNPTLFNPTGQSPHTQATLSNDKSHRTRLDPA